MTPLYKEIIKSYTASFAKWGDDPRAVQWGNVETQYLRFKILTDIEPSYRKEDVILDFGCGKGDLFFYLLSAGFRGRYIGVDVNRPLIHFAKKKYVHYSQATFRVIASEKNIRHTAYDYAFVSGVFNDKISNQQAMFERTLKELYRRARRGVAFNALSTGARVKTPGTAYFDPIAVVKFCLRKITSFVTLRHDYRGGNFTVYLYKNRGVQF